MATAGAAGALWGLEGNLPAGSSISVTVATPPAGSLLASPPGTTAVAGTAAVGEGVPLPDTTLIYAIDVSGSTQQAAGGNCGGDVNSDGLANTVLDCELQAILQLNQKALSLGTVDEAGVVAFGNTAFAADMTPQSGVQIFTPPGEATNVSQVIRSLRIGQVQLFTPALVGNGTNYAAALERATFETTQATNGTKIAIFVSDGLPTLGSTPEFNAALAAFAATGAVANTFAVGTQANCLGNSLGSLQKIADATGGKCQRVLDPTMLPDVLPGVVDAKLTALSLSIDGGAAVDITSTASSPLPVDGPASVSYSVPPVAVAPGVQPICVTATGVDGGGTGTVTDCTQVTVATIGLLPAAATNELAPGATHTVTAAVLAGPDGGVGGVGVAFEIASGPNAGATGSATTNAAGDATFTYTTRLRPGTDVIRGCFTDDSGNVACAEARKTWVDTTPPSAACTPSWNPGGKHVPRAGERSPGQNEDGFYVLTGTDNVGKVTLTLADLGSGVFFGPFESPTHIKYTQAPGRVPRQSKMGGAVDWHIFGVGDAVLVATDASGNTTRAHCFVPPPPK